MRQIYIESYFKKYKQLLDYNWLINHPRYEVIEKRIRVIEFFDKYGIEATREAFGVGRSNIYLWKKRLRESNNDLLSLVPGSRVPKNKRKREVWKEVVDFIVRYKEEHPGVGQVGIKYALDEYCKNLGIKTISKSTIARIIKDLKKKGIIFNEKKNLRINGKSGRLNERKKVKRKKLRRKGYKPEVPGDLVQMDSITRFKDGIRRYIITGKDYKSKMAFAYGYKTFSNASAKDFMEKLEKVFPFPIKRIQTDKAFEFEG